jgi:hypothetical protein
MIVTENRKAQDRPLELDYMMIAVYGAMGKRGLEINILGVYSVPDYFLER